ncbi:MAG: hypothetical protein HC881_21170 [Leptolyngbyaceae cyanobacterium SL_7_1]|nr:hypothetical protein [Leptolyngbyaceae cyanobacterium SL_7_1]
MEPDLTQNINSSDFAADEVKVELDIDPIDPIDPEDLGATTIPSASTNEQWKRVVDQGTRFVANLPDYLGETLGRYKRPIVTVGLVFGSILAVRLTLAILNSINDIPLLAPTFELIGIAYTAWFIYRYLWRASNRQQLSNDFNALKEEILGRNATK